MERGVGGLKVFEPDFLSISSDNYIYIYYKIWSWSWSGSALLCFRNKHVKCLLRSRG